jgi:hypothetical protein
MNKVIYLISIIGLILITLEDWTVSIFLISVLYLIKKIVDKIFVH